MWFVWIIVFILGLSVLVTIHELGHFIFAKFAKMHVAEFSIGFGPAIYQRQGKETTFSIRAIPMGGYVAVLSEQTRQQIVNVQNANIEDWNEWEKIKKQAEPFNIERDYSQDKIYEDAPYWKKALFISGGVAFNYFLGVIILLFVYGIDGKKTYSNSVMINNEWTNNSYIDLKYDIELDDTNKYQYLDSKMSDKFLFENTTTNTWEVFNVYGTGPNDIDNFKGYTISNFCANMSNDLNGANIGMSCASNSTATSQDIPEPGNPVVTNPDSEYMLSGYNDLWDYATKYNENIQPYVKLNSITNKIEYTDSSYVIFDATDINGTTKKYSVPSRIVKPGSIKDINKKDGIVYNSKNYRPYTFPSTLYNNGSAVVYNRKLNAGELIGYSLGDVFVYSVEMFYIVGQAIVGEPLSDTLSYRQVLADGTSYYSTGAGVMTWAVLFTSNLMLFNFMPFPPLDGYKFVEASYEEATKKKIPKNVQKWLRIFGQMFTVVFMILIFLA